MIESATGGCQDNDYADYRFTGGEITANAERCAQILSTIAMRERSLGPCSRMKSTSARLSSGARRRQMAGGWARDKRHCACTRGGWGIAR